MRTRVAPRRELAPPSRGRPLPCIAIRPPIPSPCVPPWRVLLWVKLIEAVMQLRPRALLRWLFLRDRRIRAAQRWYYRIGRRVWPYEIASWLLRERRVKALFAEPQYPRTSADAIAAETGARVYVLDPVVSGAPDADAYIKTMDRNLAVLKEALGS